jgi:hypothetical protein
MYCPDLCFCKLVESLITIKVWFGLRPNELGSGIFPFRWKQ